MTQRRRNFGFVTFEDRVTGETRRVPAHTVPVALRFVESGRGRSRVVRIVSSELDGVVIVRMYGERGRLLSSMRTGLSERAAP